MLTHRRIYLAPAAGLALVASLSACTSDSGEAPAGSQSSSARVVQLGGPGETNRLLTGTEADALKAPAHTKADVAFAQNMIPHHEQALVMIDLIDARSDNTELPKITERMAISQRDEIAQLRGWLTERSEALPVAGHQHDASHQMLMPGMLTEAELAQLRDAQGVEFDRLFLQYMIRHHEGAVIMVQDLLNKNGGGQEPAMFQLSQHISSDQQIEISRMKHLLAAM